MEIATIREANLTEIDSLFTQNFTARETQDYAPLQRQATNKETNSHNFPNTQLNLLAVTLLVI